MGWLIAFGVLALLALLPIGVSAKYDSGGPFVWMLIGPVRLRLYPTKEKQKKGKPSDKKPKTDKNAASVKTKSKDKSGGSFRDFIPLLQTILEFLSTFRKRLRVKNLEMKLVMAADDPCDLAVNYGRAWAAVGNLLPHLERIFVIKKRNIEVACDFTSDQTLIFARLDMTITVGRLLSLAAVHGIRILRQFLKITKLRKGGAKL